TFAESLVYSISSLRVAADPQVGRLIPESQPRPAWAPAATNNLELLNPVPKKLSPQQGTLEFWFRRTDASPQVAADIFSMTDGKKSLKCILSDGLSLSLDNERLLTAPAAVNSDAFSHVAFVWDRTSLSLYQNGKRTAKVDGPPVEKFKAILS